MIKTKQEQEELTETTRSGRSNTQSHVCRVGTLDCNISVHLVTVKYDEVVCS